MTINLTDPVNHPANGLLAVERIIRVREELQRTMFYANGGVIDYIVADAIKGLEELLASREADPVCFIGERMLDELSDGARSCGRVWPNVRDELSGEGRIPLYTAPPGPQSSKMSGIMPDYEGVAMTQRECYMAGKEAGLAEARKSPVITDCWIPVSERMPDDDTYAVAADIAHGEIYSAFAAWFIHGRFSVMEGLSASNYDGGAIIEIDMPITHWIPLPAAPKEVKS